MTEEELLMIEEALAVSLPNDYRILMLSNAAHSLGDAGLFNEPKVIIERTREQRQGYGGAPAWAAEFIYIGDQDDACPYALDCRTGIVQYTDHGNMVTKPLAKYESAKHLADELLMDLQPSRCNTAKSWWMFWQK